jgi:hypothetical protein
MGRAKMIEDSINFLCDRTHIYSKIFRINISKKNGLTLLLDRFKIKLLISPKLNI